MQDLRRSATGDGGLLDRLTSSALAASTDYPSPVVLRFLLARYAATGRPDLVAALEPALAGALDTAGSVDAAGVAEALFLCADASSLTADDRVPGTAAVLVERMREGWPVPPGSALAGAARAIEACLHAASTLDGRIPASEWRAAGIEELERVIGGAYRPGEGVARLAGSAEKGEPADQVAAASALLVAFDCSGRLPYSMLAEELMQGARNAASIGRFTDSCRAADVLWRLAALHADPDYRREAVTLQDADYAADAWRIVEDLADVCLEQDTAAGSEWGLVLSAWLD